MKLSELAESQMSELDDLYNRAERIAYDEASSNGGSLNDDRIFAIAKQLIQNEEPDPQKVRDMERLVDNRIRQRRMG